MTDRDKSKWSKKRTPRPPPRPLDAERLQELALAYVARFATTAAKLETYLSRKLRERGWNAGKDRGEDLGEDAGEQSGAPDSWPDLQAISARFVEMGYIDDEAYARSRSGGLLRRGYGPRRVSQDLYAAGIDEQIRSHLAPGEAAIRKAALALARKRRFGPFASEEPDRDRKQKQIAAMLRAGHGFDTVKAIMNAGSAGAAEQWAAEACADDEFEDDGTNQNEEF
jgi:regulatory protein